MILQIPLANSLLHTTCIPRVNYIHLVFHAIHILSLTPSYYITKLGRFLTDLALVHGRRLTVTTALPTCTCMLDHQLQAVVIAADTQTIQCTSILTVVARLGSAPFLRRTSTVLVWPLSLAL